MCKVMTTRGVLTTQGYRGKKEAKTKLADARQAYILIARKGVKIGQSVSIDGYRVPIQKVSRWGSRGAHAGFLPKGKRLGDYVPEGVLRKNII